MQETGISIIILFSVIIAAVSFFLKPWIIMVFILTFVYLLPRAGFLISTQWYSCPLPIGYIFVVFVMIKWLLQLLFKKGKLKRETPIDKMFLPYVIIAVLAILTGVINGGHTPTMLVEISIYFAAFFIFFMVLDMFADERSVKIFIGGILACGFIVSLYGILLLIYGKNLLVNYITYNSSNYLALLGQFVIARRTISSYGDPNTLSAQLMVFCSIFASLLLLGKNRRFLQKMFLFTSLILTIACVYFASSRASLIGLFILLMLFAMTRIKKLWLYIPILITGYFIFLEPIRKYYEHRIFTTGITSDLRITYIKTFFDLLTRFPFGVGFGNAIDSNYNLIPALNVWYGFNSFYLHIFSRMGIQGLIVFSLMLFFIIRYALTGYGRIGDSVARCFVFGGACGLVVQQFNFITNNVYHVPGGMLNFWVMCGMLTAIINSYEVKR